MELLHERCAALDIGKKELKACVRAPSPKGKRSRRQEIRTYSTTTNALLELRDWLVAEQVTLVVLEATGDYWRGAFYLLEDDLNVILVNAAHAKGLPGRKTDVCDASWLCQMGECGLLRASFVPPEPIRQLRDLTRYRTTLTAERSREAQRLEKELEDAGIKLSTVATDILGVSGREMLAALIDGERDAQVLAGMAKARMRPKESVLERDIAVRPGITGRPVGQAGQMVRVVVAPGEDARARRRAQRSGVHIRKEQPFGRQSVDIRCRDRASVTAKVAETHIVDHDEHDVGSALGSPQRCRPGGCRLLGGAADGPSEGGARPIFRQCHGSLLPGSGGIQLMHQLVDGNIEASLPVINAARPAVQQAWG